MRGKFHLFFSILWMWIKSISKVHGIFLDQIVHSTWGQFCLWSLHVTYLCWDKMGHEQDMRQCTMCGLSVDDAHWTEDKGTALSGKGDIIVQLQLLHLLVLLYKDAHFNPMWWYTSSTTMENVKPWYYKWSQKQEILQKSFHVLWIIIFVSVTLIIAFFCKRVSVENFTLHFIDCPQ